MYGNLMRPWGYTGKSSAYEVAFGTINGTYDAIKTVIPRVYHKYLRSADFAIQYGAFSVTYNANAGNDTVTVDAAKTYNFDTVVTVAAAPTRTGYTFKEWNTSADGTGTSYAAGAKLTLTANVVLYAQWTATT